MLSRRNKILFWLAIAAVLALGLGQVLADPTQPASRSSSPVIITEFMAYGAGEMPDEDGDLSDWIELHNRSRRSVNMVDWSLTDDPTDPDKWLFPSATLAPDERLILFASGKNRRDIVQDKGAVFLHTNFRLDADGGFLALYNPTSRRYLDASEFAYPAQHVGVSYGVLPGESVPQNEARHFDNPTPGETNDAASAWVGLLELVEVSAPHGVYTDTVTVALIHPDEQANILYTTDGSLPTSENGVLYEAPLALEHTTPLRTAAFRADTHRSPVTTRTYIILGDILTQNDEPPGFPSTWGTHLVDIGGHIEGAPVEADYAMDPEVIENTATNVSLSDALLALPSISLVMEMDDFVTLYSNPRERGVEWEHPVSVELLPSTGKPTGFQQDAGIRIQGGAGRWEFMPKHSFRLFFKQQYGAPKLSYQVFDDSPADSFDTLVLRAGVDRSFAGHPSTPDMPVDHRQTTYLRDEWTRASQIAASDVGSHGDFVHLYINGLYWGLYNIVERPDASFAATYLGGEKERWFSVNHGGAVSGLPDRFHVLLDLAKAGGMDDPETYATMLEFVDPVQFSDYLIVNWYAGNYDWPENNWYVNVQNPAGRNLFFVWDAEGTLDDGASIRLGPDEVEGAPYPNVTKLVFEALLHNVDFRMIFADRLYHHLHNEGALTDEASILRWRELADAVEPAIIAESARWGDVRYDEPVTVTDWQAASANVLAQMEGNGNKLIVQARELGYYPTIDPPTFSQQGGEVDSGFELTMTAAGDSPDLKIYYTLDGSDPRTSRTGEPAGRLYTGPIAISNAVAVNARTFLDGEWSALNSAEFWLPGQVSDVRITEIMYHPKDDELAEFIELTNIGERMADLSGAYMEGVEYRFPQDTLLAPGGTLVLIRDFKQYRRRYAEADFFDIYKGQLSDRGERIVLYARNGNVIDEVEYDDEAGWPLSADGAGDSLELNLTAADGTHPASWHASEVLHGTPGEMSLE